MTESKVKCPTCGKEFSRRGIGGHIWRKHGAGKDFNPNKGYQDGSRIIWNKGLTKETSEAVARNSAACRVNPAPFELDIDDDGKLYSRYSNKKVNAYLRKIEFKLTYAEYCQLVRDAGLVSSQLGYLGQKYVLGRYGDTGAYEYSNCRFITQQENMQEKISHMVFRSVKCVEDDKVFNSVASAARYYDVSESSIFDGLCYHSGYVFRLDKTFVDISL